MDQLDLSGGNSKEAAFAPIRACSMRTFAFLKNENTPYFISFNYLKTNIGPLAISKLREHARKMVFERRYNYRVIGDRNNAPRLVDI